MQTPIQKMIVTSSVKDVGYNASIGRYADKIAHKGLTDSMSTFGFRRDQPIVVNEVKTDAGIEYHILCGHRRMLSVAEILKKKPDDERFHEVPALVYQNLSPEECKEVAIDHAHRKGLNLHQTMLACRELIIVGKTNKQIAVKLGTSEAQIQKFKRVLNLPEVAQEAFKAYCEDRKNYSGPDIWSNETLLKLNDAYDKGLSEFEKTWKNASLAPKSLADAKALSRPKILELAKIIRPKNEALYTLLRHIAGDEVDYGEAIQSLCPEPVPAEPESKKKHK